MSRKTGGSVTGDCRKLEAQVAKGKPQPKLLPIELALVLIRLRPNVFQYRDPRGNASKGHVAALVTAISRSASRSLDPLTIWWDGRGWTCIDGHHRHGAYKASSVGNDHRVPVEVFQGSLSEAQARAASANSKNKLTMTSSEKSSSAWRLVVTTDRSKAQIAFDSGVSQSTVAAMRRVDALLLARHAAREFDAVGVDHQNLRWADAKRLADGRAADGFDWAAAEEKQAQKMAIDLRRAIGDQGGKRPQILARALEIYDERTKAALMECWAEGDDD